MTRRDPTPLHPTAEDYKAIVDQFAPHFAKLVERLIVLPCPFCGWHDVEIVEIAPGRYAVDCYECGCIGPFADSTAAAIAAWNRAGPPTAPAQIANALASGIARQCAARMAECGL